MPPDAPTLPRGVLAYLAVLTLVSLNTTVLGFGAPELLFGAGADLDAAAAVVDFYASRNLAALLLGLLALVSRDATLVFAAIFVRFAIETVDLGLTLTHGLLDAPALVIVAGWLAVFTGPQLLALWALRTSGPGRAMSLSESVTVAAPAGAVWAKLADHVSMPSWVLLGLKAVRLLPDGDAGVGEPGSLREITFVGWPPVTERFLAVEAPHRYRYAVIAGMPHLRDHVGTVALDPAGDATRVTWSITFVFHPLHPLSWVAPVFVAGFQRVVREALAELSRQVEAA